jgi:hypothetical protein
MDPAAFYHDDPWAQRSGMPHSMHPMHQQPPHGPPLMMGPGNMMPNAMMMMPPVGAIPPDGNPYLVAAHMHAQAAAAAFSGYQHQRDAATRATRDGGARGHSAPRDKAIRIVAPGQPYTPASQRSWSSDAPLPIDVLDVRARGSREHENSWNGRAGPGWTPWPGAGGNAGAGAHQYGMHTSHAPHRPTADHHWTASLQHGEADAIPVTKRAIADQLHSLIMCALLSPATASLGPTTPTNASQMYASSSSRVQHPPRASPQVSRCLAT